MGYKTKLRKDLLAFDKSYDTLHEDRAFAERGNFLQAFPHKKLKTLTINNYVTGKGKASFCNYIEAKTKRCGNIQGATATKFGIYFGRTKSDPTKIYRFTKKFGRNKNEAFKNIKLAILNLISAGKNKNFTDIDTIPLAQMVKAKILCLYFPDIYINICSADHIELIASELGLRGCDYISEYQHLLIKTKQGNTITKNWSNPKYTRFLYSKFIRKDLQQKRTIKKPRTKSHREVDFDEINKIRKKYGKISEKYAFKWEKNRLRGLEINKPIADLSNKPSYGYDFLSYSTPNRHRYIEVKTARKINNNGDYRFYLSENEHSVSKTNEHKKEYYFYLVLYGKNDKPIDLVVKRAIDLYPASQLIPYTYKVISNLN